MYNNLNAENTIQNICLLDSKVLMLNEKQPVFLWMKTIWRSGIGGPVWRYVINIQIICDLLFISQQLQITLSIESSQWGSVFSTASKPATLISNWYRSHFPGGNEVGREADHSSPSGPEGKNAWSYTSTPQCTFKAWFLIKRCISLHGTGAALPLPWFLYFRPV
jgi:hypothetical protein